MAFPSVQNLDQSRADSSWSDLEASTDLRHLSECITVDVGKDGTNDAHAPSSAGIPAGQWNGLNGASGSKSGTGRLHPGRLQSNQILGSFSHLSTGQRVAVFMGSGWRPATVQEVKPDRVLVLGRRLGSMSKTNFHVFDARNVSTDPRRLCEAHQEQGQEEEQAKQEELL